MEVLPSTFEVLGAQIRKRRMQMGMGARELAAKARISRRYLNHLENGSRSHMSPPRYIDLRTALDVTDEYLLAPPRPNTDKE
ncbi:hypothetical protein RVR_8239 [Actinacidiphila reveromycinica]|uniref:HTH cro/C1-type domain-containing protein n=1 Tax=Actinacidiphila reveromycinica TaxID=659352 RepID=A0A7U3VRM8_9ACTN|nr:helix-turn-helix transcriptional regulator [Streptomyces sp. SN-593]BBB01008.1 hypothetical protein RVR_8239 [Streptomyces sp. SN-593]